MGIEYKKETIKRPYESVVILNPEATEKVQKDLFTKNKQIVEQFGGEVFSVDSWGKRNLANPIKKTRLGHYFHSYFVAEPEAILELERTMKINDNVMRYVHTKLDEKVSIEKHAENFKQALKESKERQDEAEARFQKKRAMKRERK